MTRSPPHYLVSISVRQRLFWSVICGLMSYGLLARPIRHWGDLVLASVGVGLAALCVLALIAAIRLFWLKTTVLFWH